MVEDKHEELERKYVHNVYTRIVLEDVPDTPVRPKVETFIKDATPGSLLLDVGCGSGKYLSLNPEIYSMGCDVCPQYLQSSHCDSRQLTVADNLSLPYKAGVFDYVLSVAVIHHFSSESRRLGALLEIARVLAAGGRAMVCVWAREQATRQFSSQDVLVPMAPNKKATPPASRMRSNLSLDVDRSPTPSGDGVDECKNSKSTNDILSSLATFRLKAPCEKILDSPALRFINRQLSEESASKLSLDSKAPLKQQNSIPDERLRRSKSTERRSFKKRLAEPNDANFRYYHVFRAGELDDLIKDFIPDVRIVSSFFDHGNWCVVMEKIASSKPTDTPQN